VAVCSVLFKCFRRVSSVCSSMFSSLALQNGSQSVLLTAWIEVKRGMRRPRFLVMRLWYSAFEGLTPRDVHGATGEVYEWQTSSYLAANCLHYKA
jgi:hypothetical protein